MLARAYAAALRKAAGLGQNLPSGFASAFRAEARRRPKLSRAGFTGRHLPPQDGIPDRVAAQPDAWYETHTGHWLEQRQKSQAPLAAQYAEFLRKAGGAMACGHDPGARTPQQIRAHVMTCGKDKRQASELLHAFDRVDPDEIAADIERDVDKSFAKALGIGFQAPSSSKAPARQRVSSGGGGAARLRPPKGSAMSPKRRQKLTAPSLAAPGVDGMRSAAQAAATMKRSHATLAGQYAEHLRKALPDFTLLTHLGAPRLRTRPLRPGRKRLARWQHQSAHDEESLFGHVVG